jgi:adenosine deaminase
MSDRAEAAFVEDAKADLHVHLNGAIPAAVVRRVAAENGAEEIPRYQVLRPVDGLGEYFSAWQVFDQLPTSRKALDVLVAAAVGAFAADGVRYAEVRNSVLYIARLNRVSIGTAIDWLISAFEIASESTGVDARLVVTIRRQEFDRGALTELFAALSARVHERRLVGVDMAGDERAPINRRAAEQFFHSCRALGLGVALHAGEVPDGESVAWAVEACGASRIGHGLSVASSPDTCGLLRERDVCVEVCLTSNVRSGVVSRLEDHPVQGLVAAGVPFVLCSDNPALHGRPLSGEYRAFARAFGHSELELMYKRQLRYSFCGEHAGGRSCY